MTDDQNSLPVWVPTSSKQGMAAEYLAAGYSQNRTAELVETDQKTVWRWTQDQRFAKYVAWKREQLVQAQRPLYEHSVSIAQAIVMRALTGEPVDRTDYERAERLLQSTLWRTAKPRAALEEDGGPKQLPEGGDR
jgi:hypothetical protein